MTVDANGEIERAPCWRLAFGPCPEERGYGLAEWKALVRQTLRGAVKRPLTADVPAGVLLSGGLDSSLVVGVVDAEHAYFDLTLGGRNVACRESLSDQTSAVAMSRCDDQRVTHRVLQAAGLKVPRQHPAGKPDQNRKVLAALQRLVVKPARGEQGDGISVDLRTEADKDACRWTPKPSAACN